MTHYSHRIRATLILFVAGLWASPALAQVSPDERARLYFTEAAAQFNQNNFSEAVDYLDRTEELLGSTNGRILNMRVKALYNLGRFLEAEEALNAFASGYADEVTPELRSETLSYLVKIERYVEATRRERRRVARPGPTLSDSRDGKSYRTVVITGRTWMAEDLRYSAPESLTPPPDKRQTVVYKGSTLSNVCPAGWHVPSVAEWEELFRHAVREFDGTTEPRSNPRTGGPLWKGITERFLSADYIIAGERRGFDNYGLALMATPFRVTKSSGVTWLMIVPQYWTSTTGVNIAGRPARSVIQFNPRGKYDALILDERKTTPHWAPVRCVKG